MHTVGMATYLVRYGYLERCEIRHDQEENGYNVMAFSREEDGGDCYTLTHREGEELVISDYDRAVDLATRLGFKLEDIQLVTLN